MSRRPGHAAWWLALACVLAGAAVACASSPYPHSDHFDGGRFHNPKGERPLGLAAVLRWKLTSLGRPEWHSLQERTAFVRPQARIGDGELRVTFVNHATTLLQFDGHNVLTDPIWSERASPFSWIGPKRLRPAGVRFEDLPAIDVVVVSHDHYDHLDLPTLRRLESAHHPMFLVPLGCARLLADEGLVDVHELDWWQSIDARGFLASLVPAQHFGARGPFDRDQRLWAGYVLTTRGGPLFFAGDTAFGEHFAQVRARFGPMRLAVLPIGAFEPRWFMKPVHIDPAEAVAAHHALEAQHSVAMHFGTFHLADESMTGAQEGLLAALKREPEPRPAFWVLGFGEGRDVPALRR